MVQLDLVALADFVRPEEIVQEILRQNPKLPVPVPLEELAQLSGITEIKALESEGFEGALVTNLEKSKGVIFYSARNPRPRQRFTIGHELGHFLLPLHRHSRFQCTADDLNARTNKTWELEANKFSAELLMPAPLIEARISRNCFPEFPYIQSLQREFQTSLETTARRIVELSTAPCSVVFSRDNVVRYSRWSRTFPRCLRVQKGSSLPLDSPAIITLGTSIVTNEVNASRWLIPDSPDYVPGTIREQTLLQEQGHKMTTLLLLP